MSKPKKSTIDVQGTAVTVLNLNNQDYISLTDLARFRNTQEPYAIINNWMRTRGTVEFLGLWEELSNAKFKPLEFERFRNESGSNYFVLSPQRWVEATNAIGIMSKSGRYGGTFAHREIAFEFASWLSPSFKLYLIKEFQRLKDDENRRLSQDWNLNRTLAKLNYSIHTDAVKTNLIPLVVTPSQARMTYASEADVLNMALFGQTAKQWRDSNQNVNGNVRDHATIVQLLVLSNLENLNAELIYMNLPQNERLKRLNEIAIRQMQTLTVKVV